MRTGFISRGFIPFGTLTVSHGYGGFGTGQPAEVPVVLPPAVLMGMAGPTTRGTLAATPARLKPPGDDCPVKAPEAARPVRPMIRASVRAAARHRTTHKKK